MKEKSILQWTKGKSGITLIALVITIIVLLILAGVALNTLFGENGIIIQSQKAKDQTQKAEANESVYIEVMGSYDENGKINLDKLNENLKNNIADITFNGSEISETNKIKNLPATVKVNGYEVVIKGTVAESATNDGIDAKEISKEPDKYYGAIVKGYECENSAGVENWKIFYADENNIYLIAADYIHKDYCPGSANQSIYENDTPYKLSMQNVIKDYKGSEDIKESKIQSLNKSYFDYLKANGNQQSTNDNMKAVAYMLDTEVWSVYKGEKAEYAIGGPTLEMLFNSYNQKYKTNNKYQARVIDKKGYELSYDGGTNWNTKIDNNTYSLNNR